VTSAVRAARGSGLLAAIVATVCFAIAAATRADVLDETTRQRLIALKKLCDDGLVSPEVCQETQREILGLSRGSASSPRRSASAPAGREISLPAQMHESPLGFRMRLPAGWVAVRPQELQRRLALLRTRIGDGAEARRATDLLGGDAEVFMKDGDSLAVLAAVDPAPLTAADTEDLCRQISTLGAKLAGRPLRTHECAVREVAGGRTFHIDQDAVIEGRRVLQVLLDTGPGKRLRFTVTCRAANVDARRSELSEVVASVTW
jgi:hypothetical protein